MPLYGKAICLLFAAVAVVVVVVVVIVAAICGFSSNNTVTRTSVILEHPSYTSSIYETKSHIYSRISNVLAILSHEKNEQKKTIVKNQALMRIIQMPMLFFVCVHARIFYFRSPS